MKARAVVVSKNVASISFIFVLFSLKKVAINLIVEHYLSSFKNNIDTIILGCTHYPLLEPVIKKYVKDIKLVDSASAVAKHADKILNDYKIKNVNKKRGSIDCFVTDLPRQFEKLGRIFLGESINEPQLVDGF